MPALNSPKQNMHAPTKAESAHCTTSARSSKYAQSQKLSSLTSQKYRIFPHPLSREASSTHGVVRMDTYTELKLFQPPTSTHKKIRQDQTFPYPQVSMVTRCVTSAGTQNSPYLGKQPTGDTPDNQPLRKAISKKIRNSSIRKTSKKMETQHFV